MENLVFSRRESMPAINILVVDDNLLIREAMKNIFKESNFVKNVACCFGGASVIPFIERNRVDIIFMDIMLHPIDGLEIIRRVKAYNFEIKIIGFSLMCHSYFIKDVIDAGADGFISKYDVTMRNLEDEMTRVMSLK